MRLTPPRRARRRMARLGDALDVVARRSGGGAWRRPFRSLDARPRPTLLELVCPRCDVRAAATAARAAIFFCFLNEKLRSQSRTSRETPANPTHDERDSGSAVSDGASETASWMRTRGGRKALPFRAAASPTTRRGCDGRSMAVHRSMRSGSHGREVPPATARGGRRPTTSFAPRRAPALPASPGRRPRPSPPHGHDAAFGRVRAGEPQRRS